MVGSRVSGAPVLCHSRGGFPRPRDGRPDLLPQGLKQLVSYLDRLGLDRGTLIVFDARKAAEPLPGRCAMEEVEWEGRKVAVVRL
jgi:hypothetical protein